MSSRAPPSSLSSSNAVDEAPTVPIQQQQQQQQQQQVPRRPADLNDNDSSATDGDDEDEAAALHNDVVSLRRRMEQVAVREQNREGPPPDMPQVAIHGVGGDLGGVPGACAGACPTEQPAVNPHASVFVCGRYNKMQTHYHDEQRPSSIRVDTNGTGICVKSVRCLPACTHAHTHPFHDPAWGTPQASLLPVARCLHLHH